MTTSLTVNNNVKTDNTYMGLKCGNHKSTSFSKTYDQFSTLENVTFLISMTFQDLCAPWMSSENLPPAQPWANEHSLFTYGANLSKDLPAVPAQYINSAPPPGLGLQSERLYCSASHTPIYSCDNDTHSWSPEIMLIIK